MQGRGTLSRLVGLVAVIALGPSQVRALDRRNSNVPSKLTGCHLHETMQFCMDGADEYEIVLPDLADPLVVPEYYNGCHNHDATMFCTDAEGNDVEVRLLDAKPQKAGHDDNDEEAEDDNMDCHFHGSVKHCVPKKVTVDCSREDVQYTIPMRVGYIFVVLATSAVGVFGPIFLHRSLPRKLHTLFTTMKQFGTGVIISTAFVHLYTHAQIIFANECLIGLLPKYESNTAALVMMGLFLTFIVDYAGARYIRRSARKAADAGAVHKFSAQERLEVVNVTVLEAGIIFHSVLIGLTLVVTPDQAFKTMLIVIIFHQMFEGIALGTRIAALGTPGTPLPTHNSSETGIVTDTTTPEDKTASEISNAPSVENHAVASNVSLLKKCVLASLFALITPIGMAIGLAVLTTYNGKDPATLIAMGVLDALSSGILVWVGIVGMWAEDWITPGGDLYESGIWTTVLGIGGLLGGAVLMSLLGKWA